MDCGDGLACLAFNWLIENDDDARRLAELLIAFFGSAADAPGRAADLIRQHLGNIAALAAFCFGLWKWWYYRERVLHQRLFEYLKSSDVRLIDGQKYVLDALQRPSPNIPPRTPQFAKNALRSILKRRNWDTAALAASVENSASTEICKAISSIENQMKIADDVASILRKQLATAYIIRGAISAARTNPKGTHEALDAFRAALRIPGHEQNPVAKELEAHELRKLGHLDQALRAYEEIEESASRHGDYSSQRLAIAKSRRYQAEVLQAKNIIVDPDGGKKYRGCRKASKLLYPDHPNSALRIRANYAPFQNWDLLEQGDIHFLTALVAHFKTNNQIEARQLDSAESCYDGVVSGRTWKNRFSSGSRRLHSRAMTGLRLVEEARKGQYSCEWLPTS